MSMDIDDRYQVSSSKVDPSAMVDEDRRGSYEHACASPHHVLCIVLLITDVGELRGTRREPRDRISLIGTFLDALPKAYRVEF